MNKQQLASKIWESANKMRSKIEANEYKDYILGFIFYKFLSDKEVKYLKENDWTEDDIKNYLNENDKETVASIQRNIGYFIAYEDLFSTWLDMSSDFNVSNVRDALSAFNRNINTSHKKVFDKIFDTLQTGLSKLGDTSGSQTKAISDLIHLIKDIPMDGKQDYDVLGFIYEYLISNFAANAGKKAGEFYTPHEVSLLMSEIVAEHLKDRTEIKIYDPTSGSGSLLINIGNSVSKYIGSSDKIKYYAQELKENTYNLTRMNLVMRGILPSNIVTRNGDTLEDDWPYFDESDPIGTYDPLYVDAVVSNPPYSQQWNPSDKESDPRYKSYGLAPKG
ncbi:MAG: class I SAM-dependent DNA methyltransferase, partial [Eubacteriales bacterium]|nr:class I SAM-dependent DNA methyltransferase [Eubacteriales bacterium]